MPTTSASAPRSRAGCRPRHEPGFEALLSPATTESQPAANDASDGYLPAVLLQLRGDPGRPSLAGVQTELAKLDLVRQLEAAGRPVRPGASP